MHRPIAILRSERFEARGRNEITSDSIRFDRSACGTYDR
jgi:hypothetical protein